jgi:hypothetical protein
MSVSHVRLLLAAVALMAVLAPAEAQAEVLAPRQPGIPAHAESWACTAIPDRLWLPLSTLRERLEAQGLIVLEAAATRDDCYTIRLRGPDMVERTVIFDPVSAKPLK